MLVEAIDARAADFYRRYGFTLSPIHPCSSCFAGMASGRRLSSLHRARSTRREGGSQRQQGQLGGFHREYGLHRKERTPKLTSVLLTAVEVIDVDD